MRRRFSTAASDFRGASVRRNGSLRWHAKCCPRARAKGSPARARRDLRGLARADGDDLIDPATGDFVEAHAGAGGDRRGDRGLRARRPRRPSRRRSTPTSCTRCPAAATTRCAACRACPASRASRSGSAGSRCAAPRRTTPRVYLDDIPVPILYHFGGFASFLPIDAVDEVDMVASGAGARVGRRHRRRRRRSTRSRTRPTHVVAPTARSASCTPACSRPARARRRQLDDRPAPQLLRRRARAPRRSTLRSRRATSTRSCAGSRGDKKWLAIAFASQDDLHMIHDPNAACRSAASTTRASARSTTTRGSSRAGLRYQRRRRDA